MDLPLTVYVTVEGGVAEVTGVYDAGGHAVEFEVVTDDRDAAAEEEEDADG